LFGAKGITVATLLSAIAIPLFNILAIITLTVFGDGEKKVNIKDLFLGIAKNPLIIGVFTGLAVLGVRTVFVKTGIDFRLSDIRPLYTAAQYLSDLSTPMALLVLGAQFEFSAVKALRREIIAGTLARTLVAPLLGVGVAYLFFCDSFSGAQFAAFVALFATPVAVSSLPMAQEMKNDAALAGQLVVWTTLFSSLSIFLCAFLLRLAGVFA
jgi:predicted permease